MWLPRIALRLKALPGPRPPGGRFCLCHPVSQCPFPMTWTESSYPRWQTFTGTISDFPVQVASFCSLAVDSVSSKSLHPIYLERKKKILQNKKKKLKIMKLATSTPAYSHCAVWSLVENEIYFFFKCVHFWPCWIFVAVHRLSLQLQ